MCSRVSVDLSLHYLAESTKEQLAISRFVDSNEAVAKTRTCLLYNRELNSHVMNKSTICGRTERILVYYLLVKPTVTWGVHLVELGQHGPDGFVGEVVHQLLEAKRENSSRKFYSVFLHQEKPNIYFSLGTGDFILVIRLNPSRIKTCLCSIKTKSKTCLPAGRHQRYHRTAPRGCRRCRGRPCWSCCSGPA